MAKIECPYCQEAETFGDMDEMNVHILKEHPEKTSLEENKADRKSRVWGAALSLTDTSFAYGQQLAPSGKEYIAYSKEQVLERFKFFLIQLMGMGL